MGSWFQVQPSTCVLAAYLHLPWPEAESRASLPSGPTQWDISYFLTDNSLLIQTDQIISLLVGKYLEGMNKTSSKSQKEELLMIQVSPFLSNRQQEQLEMTEPQDTIYQNKLIQFHLKTELIDGDYQHLENYLNHVNLLSDLLKSPE